MRVAYLASKYPAVSHTFVLREVRALRELGVDVYTFSVRRARAADVLGDEAAAEAARTLALVPPPIGRWLAALAWCLFTRPARLASGLADAALRGRVTVGQRLKWLCYLGEAVLLAREIVRTGCHHLHCHFGNAGSSTAMLAARLAGVPFSITCHGSELRDLDRYRLVEKVARAAFVICVSHHGRAQLMLACPPAHWSKLHVVRCGVPAAPPRRNVPADAPLALLCVGRLSPEKGHLVLLEALARLRAGGLAFRCTLVGDGPLRCTIEQRRSELGLEHEVAMTGALPPEALPEWYARSDAVVLASFSEGVPVVLMEALAFEAPVVATRVGGVAELIIDGQTGTLVDPGDAGALAEAIRRVAEDRPAAAALARAGRKRVLDEFNPDRAARRLHELFAGTAPRAAAAVGAEPVAARAPESMVAP